MKSSNTIAILPKRDVAGCGLRIGVAPTALPGFRLSWIRNNNVEVFDSQYAMWSLLS